MHSSEYDEIRSVECTNGIAWIYMSNNSILDNAFMTYKELYEIQIGKA